MATYWNGQTENDERGFKKQVRDINVCNERTASAMRKKFIRSLNMKS